MIGSGSLKGAQKPEGGYARRVIVHVLSCAIAGVIYGPLFLWSTRIGGLASWGGAIVFAAALSGLVVASAGVAIGRILK
jgi:hypothetical protein